MTNNYEKKKLRSHTRKKPTNTLFRFAKYKPSLIKDNSKLDLLAYWRQTKLPRGKINLRNKKGLLSDQSCEMNLKHREMYFQPGSFTGCKNKVSLWCHIKVVTFEDHHFHKFYASDQILDIFILFLFYYLQRACLIKYYIISHEL